MRVASNGTVIDSFCDWCRQTRKPEDFYVSKTFDEGTHFQKTIRTTDSRCVSCRRLMSFEKRERRRG